jgi:hypothetical protein
MIGVRVEDVSCMVPINYAYDSHRIGDHIAIGISIDQHLAGAVEPILAKGVPLAASLALINHSGRVASLMRYPVRHLAGAVWVARPADEDLVVAGWEIERP